MNSLHSLESLAGLLVDPEVPCPYFKCNGCAHEERPTYRNRFHAESFKKPCLPGLGTPRVVPIPASSQVGWSQVPRLVYVPMEGGLQFPSLPTPLGTQSGLSKGHSSSSMAKTSFSTGFPTIRMSCNSILPRDNVPTLRSNPLATHDGNFSQCNSPCRQPNPKVRQRSSEVLENNFGIPEQAWSNRYNPQESVPSKHLFARLGLAFARQWHPGHSLQRDHAMNCRKSF